MESWLLRKRVERLEREIAILQSMSVRLWAKRWLCGLFQFAFTLLVIALVVYYMISSGYSAEAIAAVTTISAFTAIFLLRDPFRFLIFLTTLIISIVLAFIFEEQITDAYWPDRNKAARSTKLQNAILKRQLLIGKLNARGAARSR